MQHETIPRPEKRSGHKDLAPLSCNSLRRKKRTLLTMASFPVKWTGGCGTLANEKGGGGVLASGTLVKVGPLHPWPCMPLVLVAASCLCHGRQRVMPLPTRDVKFGLKAQTRSAGEFIGRPGQQTRRRGGHGRGFKSRLAAGAANRLVGRGHPLPPAWAAGPPG